MLKLVKNIFRWLGRNSSKKASYLEDIACPVVVIDKIGQIIHFNSKFKNVLLLETERIIGRRISDLRKDKTLRGMEKRVFHCLQTGFSDKCEIEINSESEFSQFYEVYIVSSKVFRGRVQEVTITFQNQTKLNELRKRNEIDQQFVILGQISASIMHEIKNPLTSLLLRCDFFSSKSDDFSQETIDVSKFVSETKNAVNRIISIISSSQQILTNSRVNDLEEVKLVDLIREALDINQVKIEQTKAFVRVIGTEGMILKCKKIQIIQVLSNLIGNSCDAISDLDQRWLEIEYNHFNDDVRISVKDSGLGIPEPLRARIGELLFTTKPSGLGTGLGLHLVCKILKLHGGRLYFDHSAPHTIAVVEIPRSLT